jgi:succinoglycan biosynthesis transport protein ExoP
MKTSDHPDQPLPAWQPAPPPALRTAEPWDEMAEAGAHAPAGRGFNARIVWRAARRHWWQILLLWTTLSGGLMYLAYDKIKTSYTATVWLIVRSNSPRIFAGDQGGGGSDNLTRYQKTQVELVTSPDVLGNTLAKHPDLTKQPILRGSDDPEAEIRKALSVTVKVDTSLITVAMSSEDPAEAKAIVEAVAESYLAEANNWASEESRAQVERLKKEVEKLDVSVDAKQEKLRKLVQKVGNVDPSDLKDQNRLSMERFNGFVAHLDAARLQRMELESALESARVRAGRAVPKAAQQAGQEQLADLFYNHPQVTVLREERERLLGKLDAAKRLVRKERWATDPSVVQTQKKMDDVDYKIERLKPKLIPQLRRSLVQDAPVDENEKAVQELEAQLNAAKNMEGSLQETLQRMQVDSKRAGEDALEVTFAHAELEGDKKLRASIQSQIQQIEFESKGPQRVDKANARTRVDPSINKRVKVMAAMPVLVLAVVLGMFVMLEIRSGRVSDPDEVAARVRVEVIAVVPPLPSLRPTRALWGKGDEFRARRQLEEFVQSLDHLRVALTAGRTRAGEARRCVLITSACSSEGKTTLAAHLAGRCANAGLSTLLIDADLRNPSLSRLLKVPDGPGLTDVLRGEVSAESAMMVIEAGGGFHLLPAGTSGGDPSRLLQGDLLGTLLGEFRKAFDIVIMDAPPVLLVPDALTVGRWADGALLAVRYDTSRFPLVERAHRRLASVGVPIIGAVVNGVRTMESSYGYYSYAYHADRSSSPVSGTIDVPAEPMA